MMKKSIFDQPWEKTELSSQYFYRKYYKIIILWKSYYKEDAAQEYRTKYVMEMDQVVN